MTERGDEEATGHGDSAGVDLGPEVWRLAHPRHGTLEVAVGGPWRLRTVDPGFPVGKAEPEDDPPTNPGYVLLRDGATVARARQVGDHKLAIDADPPEQGEPTTDLKALSGPRVLTRSNMLRTEVRQVTFREGSEVVHFDPPPGSAAEARLEAIAASPWKRVVYPVGAGIGKSGWAIAMIVLLPILARLLSPVVDWIVERIPDIDIPWPDLPSIPWPDITLPSINLPEVNLPWWLEFLLEYSKVWVPLVIGVAIAVVAVRHSRRSRRIKEGWQGEQAEQGKEGEQNDEGEHGKEGEQNEEGEQGEGG